MDEATKDLAKSLIGSYVRMALAFVVGYLVTTLGGSHEQGEVILRPLLSPNNTVLGALAIFVITTVWKARKHLHLNKKIEVALTLRPGASRADLERTVKEI
jgi:cation transporter-like permease